VKKVFQLTDTKKHADRVLEAIKHEIRKYTKREKRKELADPETTYWDFDCQIGATQAEANPIAYKELLKALDTMQSTGATQAYIEIMVKAVPKPIRLPKTETDTEEPASQTPVEDRVDS